MSDKCPFCGQELWDKQSEWQTGEKAMTPPISRGPQSPVVISCPCPALPEGMVVVEKWKLESASWLLMETGCISTANSLRAALEKKP